MTRTHWLALAVVFVTGSATLQAQEPLAHQHQGTGYTIRYPAGWRVLDPQSMATLNKSVNSALPITRGTGTDVMICKSFSPDSSPNLNVVVVNDEMPINDEARQILKSWPGKIASALRGRAEDIVVRDETSGGHPGLVVQYDLSVAGKKLTQMLFSIPKSGKTFMICCTAPKDEFRSMEPTFRMMISSVEFSFLSSMPRWLMFGLIGCCIGGLVTFLAKMLKTTPVSTPSVRV